MRPAGTKKVDFTEGPLLRKMILFAIPILVAGILQISYNSADSIIVGKFSGDENALGAVGSTGNVYTVIVQLVMGLGTGTSVLIAQFIGAKDEENVSKTVHTSMTIAVLGGIVIMFAGLWASEPLLRLLGTNEELFDQALLYLKIIFLGVPGAALFNFGALAIRASGDSKTPMIIPAVTGLLNVLLNMLFVIVFDMSVAGVATATVVANYASGIATTVILMRRNDALRFSIRKMAIHFSLFKQMLLLGIPTAIQTCLVTVSNMVLQSAVNTLPVAMISGVAIGMTLEGYMYMITQSVYQTAVTFIGQNYGAKRFDRTKKAMWCAFLIAGVASAIAASTIIIFNEPIASLFIDADAQNRAAVIAAVGERNSITTSLYVLLGFADVLIAFMRGYGSSIAPMVASIFYNIVLRILWARFVFPLDGFNSIVGLYTVYPISWIVGICILTVMTVRTYKKTVARYDLPKINPSPEK